MAKLRKKLTASDLRSRGYWPASVVVRELREAVDALEADYGSKWVKYSISVRIKEAPDGE